VGESGRERRAPRVGRPGGEDQVREGRGTEYAVVGKETGRINKDFLTEGKGGQCMGRWEKGKEKGKVLMPSMGSIKKNEVNEFMWSEGGKKKKGAPFGTLKKKGVRRQGRSGLGEKSEPGKKEEGSKENLMSGKSDRTRSFLTGEKRSRVKREKRGAIMEKRVPGGWTWFFRGEQKGASTKGGEQSKKDCRRGGGT